MTQQAISCHGGVSECSCHAFQKQGASSSISQCTTTCLDLQVGNCSAGLCPHRELRRNVKGHCFRGWPHVLLPWAILLRCRMRRMKGSLGWAYRESCERRQAQTAQGESGRSSLIFTSALRAACGSITKPLQTLFCSSVNWANNYTNFFLFLWGQNELKSMYHNVWDVFHKVQLYFSL